MHQNPALTFKGYKRQLKSMSLQHRSSTEAPKFWALCLATLGVVFGDIGTSPLYAFKEAFSEHYGLALNTDNILGVLSLFFWSLILIVIVKYLILVTRANNKGEGGIIALIALLLPKDHLRSQRIGTPLILMGLFGAALLYGDGMITPAISVLSAVEGLQVATPVFKPYIIPITILILILIFTAQKSGTHRIGVFFGPLILIWFISIAAIAIPWIIKQPIVFKAINPYYAYQFFIHNGMLGFFALGAVVLCVTGTEAMYADMGHVGIKPIRFMWYRFVFPALVINYFGQGALLLEKGELAVSNPFYSLVPPTLLYPMVIIATLAALIASQALITGIFSLTHQATQLGYLPRFQVVHTSEQSEGQIYLPQVSRLLMVCCVMLVIYFKESGHLATAYGVAVTGTMAITSILFYRVATKLWNWSQFVALPLLIGLLSLDLIYFSANLAKFFNGGWFPIAVGAVMITVMLTWRQGRILLSGAMLKKSMPIDEFIQTIKETKPHRVSGTAMVMTANAGLAPPVLLHQFRHNQVLHELVILLTVDIKNKPYVTPDDRLQVNKIDEGFYKVIASYGFIQKPNVAEMIRLLKATGLPITGKTTSFYLGRETLIPTGKSKMARWRKGLFVFLSKNAQSATASFRITPDTVVEVGLQLEI